VASVFQRRVLYEIPPPSLSSALQPLETATRCR